ncbi:MAG: sulfotransferase [Zetaproteobacteria bacterium]|nr:MAG: sulfotransferase [Zetaproteobacteria bacterium]
MKAKRQCAAQPFFLLALSRSGSTLLQRMLATHPEITTSTEPWLLLPLMDMLQHTGCTFSAYGHELAIRAIGEFAEARLGGMQRVWEAARTFALTLYAEAAGEGARYFLDKTPAYALICRQLMRLFPEARFVWLVRQPLAVVASLVETFADGKWYLYRRHHELYWGLAELCACFLEHRERMIRIRYEDLLLHPEREMQRAFAYLELDGSKADWRRFTRVDLGGAMQDPTGVRRYRSLSREPLEKWRHAFTNPFRKAWARRYLRWIGQERLALMGYELDALLEELDAIPQRMHGVLSDAARHIYGWWRVRTQADAAALVRQLPPERRSALH